MVGWLGIGRFNLLPGRNVLEHEPPSPSIFGLARSSGYQTSIAKE
jgi:hypothetical protein